MDTATEREAVMQQQAELDVIGRPLPKAERPKPSTTRPRPARRPAQHGPSTQLEAAVSTMVGHIILDGRPRRRCPGHPDPAPGDAAPATQPAGKAA